MKDPDTSAGLSWKRGFLHNKVKGNINTHALPQVQVKRAPKKQCPRVEKSGNKFQQNFPTGGAVLDGSNLAMATDPALLSLLNVTTATAPTIGTGQRICQQDSTTGNTTDSGTTPQNSLKHDDGHIHRASPVRGLPPERQQNKGKSAIRHNDQVSTSPNTMEESLFPMGQGSQQTGRNAASPTTAATQSEKDLQLILGDSPHPPPPSAAKKGPVAEKSAIDAGCDIPALPKKAPSSQPSPLDAEDRCHIPPFIDKLPSKQPQDDCQRKSIKTDRVMERDARPEGQRARQKRFGWHQGFLMAHKPPIRRPMPSSTPNRPNPPANQGPNTPPRAWPVDDNTPNTMAQPSGPRFFMQRYDLRVNLRGPDGAIYSEWEGITNLFLQLQGFDTSIEVWPWSVADQHHNPPIPINRITQVFFDLQTYLPGLASTQVSLRTRLELGDKRHPFLLLRSSVPPTQLADKMGPWLEATKQRIWVRQLPLVEQTRCIGWLLYSAPEYNLDNLHKQIKKDTGINVELRFRSIADKGAGWILRTIPRTKAIHLEVDISTTSLQLQRLERVYSAQAKRFPLGIKMRLVPTGTGTNAEANDGQMIQRQARFLKYTVTRCIRINDRELKPQQCPLYDTLREMTLPPSQANQRRKPLFHAVSPSPTEDGYLVRYLPQYRAPAQAAITRLYNQPVTTLVGSASQPTTSKNLQNPALGVSSSAPNFAEAAFQGIWSRFNIPYLSSLTPQPHLTSPSTHPINFSPTPSPSHYKLFTWRAALLQKFQNTAWDRWRYRNGVP